MENQEIMFYARRADGLVIVAEVWPISFRPSSVEEALKRLRLEALAAGYEGGSRLTGEVWIA